LAQATSSAGGGFVGIWGGGYLPPWREEDELERYGLDFYARLAGEGYDLEYKRNGNLWAATTQEAWERYVAVIADREAVPMEQLELDSPGD
jgi:sarcosine oxidase subunit beta